MYEKAVRLAHFCIRTTLQNKESLQEHIEEFRIKCKDTIPYIIVIDLSEASVFKAQGLECSEVIIGKITEWICELGFSNAVLFRFDPYELDLLIDASSLLELNKTLQTLRDRFSEPWYISSVDMSMCFYFEAAFSVIRLLEPSRMPNLDELRHYTLINAKKAGTASIFDPEYDPAYYRSTSINVCLNEEFERNFANFQIAFEQLISINSSIIAGYFARVVWDCPGIGLISGTELEKALEENNLTVEYQSWLIHEAFSAELKLLHSMSFTIYIQLEASCLYDNAFLIELSDASEELLIPVEKLCLLMPCSDGFVFSDEVKERIESIANCGVSLGLSNFGNGFSSMALINSLPISYALFNDEIFHAYNDSSFVLSLYRFLSSFGVESGMQFVIRANTANNFSKQNFWLSEETDSGKHA